MYLIYNSQQYFINIQPVDSWDEWIYEIIEEDIFAPMCVTYKSDPESPFKSYFDALDDAKQRIGVQKYHTLKDFPTLPTGNVFNSPVQNTTNYIVTDAIWLGGVIWDVGTELTLDGYRLVDKNGAWLNINYTKNKVRLA